MTENMLLFRTVTILRRVFSVPLLLADLKLFDYKTLSSTGSILSNTDLSDLSTVGTCEYLFSKCVTESCDSPDWLIHYCLSSASSRVTETVSMKMPCGECFQKCFSANNLISLWLNTVIPIIVMIWLPNMTRYLQ